MKLARPAAWRKPSELVAEVELDMTPIMNMMVILIPILVSMAVFTHFATLQFSLPPSAGIAAGGPTRADLRLTLVVGVASVKVTLGDRIVGELSDLSQLGQRLQVIRSSLGRNEDVVIAFDDRVQFERVVRVMDICRGSGFRKLALAEGEQGK